MHNWVQEVHTGQRVAEKVLAAGRDGRLADHTARSHCQEVVRSPDGIQPAADQEEVLAGDVFESDRNQDTLVRVEHRTVPGHLEIRIQILAMVEPVDGLMEDRQARTLEDRPE